MFAFWATWSSTCGTVEARRPSWKTILRARGTTSFGTWRCSSTSLMWSPASWRRTCTITRAALRPSCRTRQKPRSSASSTRWTWSRRINETWYSSGALSSVSLGHKRLPFFHLPTDIPRTGRKSPAAVQTAGLHLFPDIHLGRNSVQSESVHLPRAFSDEH